MFTNILNQLGYVFNLGGEGLLSDLAKGADAWHDRLFKAILYLCGLIGVAALLNYFGYEVVNLYLLFALNIFMLYLLSRPRLIGILGGAGLAVGEKGNRPAEAEKVINEYFRIVGSILFYINIAGLLLYYLSIRNNPHIVVTTLLIVTGFFCYAVRYRQPIRFEKSITYSFLCVALVVSFLSMIHPAFYLHRLNLGFVADFLTVDNTEKIAFEIQEADKAYREENFSDKLNRAKRIVAEGGFEALEVMREADPELPSKEDILDIITKSRAKSPSLEDDDNDKDRGGMPEEKLGEWDFRNGKLVPRLMPGETVERDFKLRPGSRSPLVSIPAHCTFQFTNLDPVYVAGNGKARRLVRPGADDYYDFGTIIGSTSLRFSAPPDSWARVKLVITKNA